MGEFDWTAFLAGALQAGAIGAGLIFAGRRVRISADQNRDAERWRRTVFAASLMERLSNDEVLELCARALDWGVGPLIVPTKYRILFTEARSQRPHVTVTSPLPSALDTAPITFGIDASASAGFSRPIESDAQFTHNWAMLARAVRPGLDENWSDPRMLVYRYCFDSFGEFLETIQRHIDLDNVLPAHLFGLRYYLDLLASPSYYAMLPPEQRLAGVEAEDVFRPFMIKYYPEAWHLVDTVVGYRAHDKIIMALEAPGCASRRGVVGPVRPTRFPDWSADEVTGALKSHEL